MLRIRDDLGRRGDDGLAARVTCEELGERLLSRGNSRYENPAVGVRLTKSRGLR